MASQRELNATGFNVQRLRTDDAAVLAASVRAPAYLPDPIALATGPSATGPAAGAVGANEMWSLTMSVPATEVAWVLVQVNYNLWAKTGVVPAASYFLPVGSLSGPGGQPPPLGHGANLTSLAGAVSAGTYVDLIVPDKPDPRLTWVVYDPAITIDGFTPALFTKAPAGGLAQNDLRYYLAYTYILGYPLSLWDTGALNQPASYRGS